MNKKIIMAVVALVAVGGAYKFVLAKPKAAAQEAERRGHALRAPEGVPGQPRRRALREGVGGAAAEPEGPLGRGRRRPRRARRPPEGYGAMAQEAVVRAIITDELTGLPADELEDAKKRDKLRKDILRAHPQGVRRARRRRPVPRPDGAVAHEREHRHRARRLRALRGHGRRPSRPGAASRRRPGAAPRRPRRARGRDRPHAHDDRRDAGLGPGSIVTLTAWPASPSTSWSTASRSPAARSS